MQTKKQNHKIDEPELDYMETKRYLDSIHPGNDTLVSRMNIGTEFWCECDLYSNLQNCLFINHCLNCGKPKKHLFKN